MFSIIVHPADGAWRVTFAGRGGRVAIYAGSKANVARIIARATNGMRLA